MDGALGKLTLFDTAVQRELLELGYQDTRLTSIALLAVLHFFTSEGRAGKCTAGKALLLSAMQGQESRKAFLFVCLPHTLEGT